MARIRSIKPEFFLHEGLSDLSPLHRLFFIGLWTIADRRGRLEDRPKRIKAAIFPWDEVDTEALLADLDRAGFIIRYEAGGKRCIQIPSFSTHQKPHPREGMFDLPDPTPEVFGREISRLAAKENGEPEKGMAQPGKGDDEQRGVWRMENGERPPAAPPAPLKPAFDFLKAADQLRSEAFPSALQDAPESGRLLAWWKLATATVPPDLLLEAYRAFLRDTWVAGLSPPAPWNVWQSQWKRHVPGQSGAAPNPPKKRSANGF